MIPTPEKLLAEIDSGEIPLADIFSNADCNSLLDKRDSDSSFDSTYGAVWDTIEKHKSKLDRDPTEPIRKQSFLAVSNVTQQHEIASYVSDDFELVAWHSLALNREEISSSVSEFVEWIYSQYRSGQFPCPPYIRGN